MIVQDVVVLNKVDLVPGELADVEAQIRKINALVKIVHSVRCQLNLKDILDRRSFDVQVVQLPLGDIQRAVSSSLL